MPERMIHLRLLPLFLLAAAMPFSVAAGGIAAALVIVTAGAMAWRERGRAAWPPRAVLVAFGALILAYFVATAAALPYPMNWHKFGEELWLKLLLIAVPVLAGEHARRLPRVLGVLLLAASLVAVYTFWQHGSGVDPVRDRSLVSPEGQIHVSGFFSHHLSWGGHLLAVILAAAAWLLAGRWRPRSGLLGLVLVLCGLSLTWTLARSAFLGVLAGLAVIVACVPGRRRVAGAVVLLVPVLVGLIVPDLRTRLVETLDPTVNETRVNLWESSLHGVAARPLTGWGPGNFEFMMEDHEVPGEYDVRGHAHNDLLMHGVNAGVPGLLAALALILTVAAALWRGWRRRVPAAWLALAALAVQAGITVAGIFQVYQTDDEVELAVYLVLGCGLAVAGQATAESPDTD